MNGENQYYMITRPDPLLPVRVIAHRGFSGKYPENTLLAFEKAIEIGVDEIEFDVKMTKDGYPVIMHDETVERTTNGKGRVCDLTLNQIKKMRVILSGASEVVPTFEEALKIIPEKIDLNIHTLSNPLLIEKVTKILLKEERVKNCYLAIESSMIPFARKIYPEIRMCNMRGQTDPWKYIEETKKWKCERLQFFTPSYEVSEEMVKRAHSYGIFVNVFYADTEQDMKKYIRIGVDAILTNYPDILISLVSKWKTRNIQRNIL